MLSHTAQYALNAVLHVAEFGGERPVPVGEIAEALGVPRNYLSKTLHQLGRAGILTSTFGPGGGFRLAVAPEHLTLDAVVAPFDDAGVQRHCLLGRPRCADADPCLAHAHWKGIAEQIHRFFRSTTVATLVAGDVAEAELLSAAAPRRRRARGSSA